MGPVMPQTRIMARATKKALGLPERRVMWAASFSKRTEKSPLCDLFVAIVFDLKRKSQTKTADFFYLGQGLRVSYSSSSSVSFSAVMLMPLMASSVSNWSASFSSSRVSSKMLAISSRPKVRASCTRLP